MERDVAAVVRDVGPPVAAWPVPLRPVRCHAHPDGRAGEAVSYEHVGLIIGVAWHEVRRIGAEDGVAAVTTGDR